MLRKSGTISQRMKNNQLVLESVAKIFIWIAPITGFPFFKALFRESSGEGLLYATLIVTPLIILYGVKCCFVIIKPVKMLLTVFVCAMVLIFFKISHLDIIFMNRTGFSRYLSQMLSFVFVLYSMIIMSNVFLRIPLDKLLSIILKGFYIQIVVIYIQLLVFFSNSGFLTQIYENIFSLFIENEVLMNSLGRPHGLAKEPSHLAIYVLLCWPVYLFKNKFISIKTTLIILAIGSMQSRSLTVMILIQSLAFYLTQSTKQRKLISYFYTLTFLLFVFYVFGDFIQSSVNIEQSGSTYTRFVALYSSFRVFMEHPVSGVGFGLTSFFSHWYFNDFGLFSNEVRDVVYGKRFPFIHNMHLRILSDLGVIGFLLWLRLILFQTRLAKKLDKISQHKPLLFALSIIYPLIFFTKENIGFMNIWLYSVVIFCIYTSVKKIEQRIIS